jgi:hypothetical protein
VSAVSDDRLTGKANHLMQAEKDMEAVLLMGDGDPEVSHGEADAILCRALKLLGYRHLVDLYERVPKWYA